MQICHLMFVKMSGALLPSFSLFCPAIAQPLAEMLMQLVPIDVISQGDRRPLLHHCPGIAIRLTPSRPRKRSPGGDDCSRDRPVRSSEIATTSRMKRTSATFDERSWAPSAAPIEHGTKGGFGGFAASCERRIADQTGSFALATWSILTKVRWQICTEIL